MKYLKMLGLAAVAAAALMAFGGAGTASASVVCSTAVSPCPAAQKWPNTVNGIDFSTENSTGTGAGKATLEDEFGFVKNECESTVQGTLTNGSATATATLSGITLTWSNCTRTTATIATGTLEIHNIASSNNGTVTAKGFEVTSKVPKLFEGGEESCIFESGTTGLDLGTLTAGTPPTMDVSTTVALAPNQGPNCPANAKWTAKYKLTTPSGTTGDLSTS